MNLPELLPLLCEWLAKSVVVFIVALLVERAWTGATAAQRHLVWAVAFGILLLLPATRWVAPRWTVPIERVRVELLPPESLPSLAPAAVSANTAARPAAQAKRPSWRWPGWKQLAVGAWVAGVGFLLLGRWAGSVSLARLRRRSGPLADARLRRLAEEVLREAGIRRAVEVRLAANDCVPLTWGTWRPILLLPAGARQWSEGQLVTALRHEAGHIARRDHLVRRLAHFACILYWPNPLVWLAARRLRAAQEEATDDLVLRGGATPEDYAEQLLQVARSLAGRENSLRLAVAMASPSTFERRMLAILDARRDRRPLSRAAWCGGGVALLLALTISAFAQLRAQEGRSTATATAEATPVQQILIESRFVEIDREAREALAGLLGMPQPEIQGAAKGAIILSGVLSEAQFDTVLRGLGQLKEADLLSAPKVTTRSGQRAVVEIAREVRYPTEFEKDGAGWKPKSFETRNVGITFEVEPVAGADGQTLDLALTPSLVRLLGWTDLENGKKYPVPARSGLALDADAIEATGAPVDHRLRPAFSTHKIVTTKVSVWDGQTVVLASAGESPENAEFPGARPDRQLLVFVTARRVFPGSAGGLSPVPPEATHAIPLSVATRIPFPTGDSVELLELRGSEPELKLYATYWLRGRYELRSRDKARLYLGNTSVTDPAIEAAPGGIHLAAIGKGRGEFAYSFKLLAPGRVHIGLYDAEKTGGQNNVFGSWSLGVIEPGSGAPPFVSPVWEKARALVLPKVEFREATLAEMLAFFREQAAAADTAAGAGKRGVEIALDPAVESSGAARISLSLREVPLSEALGYVASLVGLEVAAEPNALILRSPKGASNLKLVTVEYRLTPGQVARVASKGLESIPAFLKTHGITLPGKATLGFDEKTGVLSMRNTQQAQDQFAGILERIGGGDADR